MTDSNRARTQSQEASSQSLSMEERVTRLEEQMAGVVTMLCEYLDLVEERLDNAGPGDIASLKGELGMIRKLAVAVAP